MATSVNLQELLIERTQREPVVRRRNAFSRAFVPGLLLCGFIGVLGWSFRDSLRPATPITVVAVIATRSEIVAADKPLFRAAGWIEPRPQPSVVSALIEGIVDEMLVVEGQPIEAGQTVARLIRRDAEIALRRAEATVNLREAEVKAARAAMTAAESLFKEPVSLLAGLADSDAAVAKVETELARLPALKRGAEAKRDFSEREVAGKTQATASVPVIAIQRAKSDLEAAVALLDEYHQQVKSLENERRALEKRREILQRQLELKVDETRRLAETQAQLQIAESQLEQSKADRDSARLSLERTEVRAKSSGKVLALVARPGSRLMGIDRAATIDASTVFTMYDPKLLQVRADVRLEDVPRILIGQSVQIETPAYPQILTGQVLMATSMADIQKNTLQLKLTIDDPPEVLKPDMLVQVTFLASAKETPQGNVPSLKLFAPKELVQGSGEESTVWLIDQTTETANLRRVTTGATTSEGLVEITTGLNVGDRLIVKGRDSLAKGQRVKIVGNHAVSEREPTGMANDSRAIKSSQIQRSGNNN